ncbi:Vacuolar protein sorting-associated protein atg6 [Microbotryomycetes sp. JL201]|nr:Vacuolar protein sorting-associated protein atg6 [Microbotryomycetes sp. JL201]
MNIIASCQKCRQPLSFGDESLATLGRSTYDLLTASERQPEPQVHRHKQNSVAIDRLGPQQRALFDAAQRPSLSTAGHRQLHSPTTQQQSNPTRVRVPAPLSAQPFRPAESFVMLDHVAQSLAALPQVGPNSSAAQQGQARPSASRTINLSDSPANDASLPSALPSDRTSLGGSNGVYAADTPGEAAPLTPRIAQLSNLYSLLSSKSSIDHPLCTECIEQLLPLMSKQLDEAKKERERLLAFEKDVLKRKDEGQVQTREQSQKEIAKYKKAERQAVEDLKAVEAERDLLDKQKVELDAEEAKLAKEEEEFWLQHSAYLLEAAALRERTNALQTRYAHDLKELEKLQRTNVYNDAFCIGQENGIGTINGLRLGRLPNVPVDWPEINAAWGHCLLLLHTIARKFSFQFDNYRLVPMGSFSKIEKTSGDKATLELYGSGDFAVMRLLQNRRFDIAMVAFLDCLRQIGEFVSQRDKDLRLQHKIVKDKIGDVSIKLQFGSDEAWTRALRHVLYDLKLLLGRADWVLLESKLRAFPI